MLKKILLFSVFGITFLTPRLFSQAPTPFSCPVMVGLLNEGPNPPDHDSYITVIDASTGSVGVQLPVRDSNGVIYQSLNGIGIVNTDGYGYAQYQRVPTLGEVVSGLLSGNYTYPSSMIQIGSNGIGKTLGSLVPPVSSGFNAHVVLGLLGSADNSGNYLVAALEGQVDAFTQVVSSYRFYVGRVSVPDTAVVWSAISLDTSCRVFIDGVIANLQLGQNRGAQDMVWDYNTNRLLLYSGIDKVLAVVDLNTNSSICYSDDNNVSVTDNLGGLALDSVGQLIGLEVQTGRVLRIDTRGCIDGNPATPCMTSVTSINNYTINGNGNTRGDAASCVSACTPPVITSSDVVTCVGSPTTVDISVSGATGPYSYVWGINQNSGTITNTTSEDVSYENDTAGSYKLYVTVSDIRGCQSTDSIDVSVVLPPDTVRQTAGLCFGDSLLFGSTIINSLGVYTRTLITSLGCDSVIELRVIRGSGCGILTPFSCPVMVGLLNEGPNPPDHDSYITVIDASTGSVGVQLPVRDSNGVIYQSLNGIGIVNTDGYGYAQYQRVPTLGEVVSGLLSGNYTYPSSMIQIGSNGIGKTLGSLVPPVSSGFNAHVVLGLLGSADNSGNYLVAALEGQVDAFTQVVSSYRFYVGRVSVPDTAVVWSAISLDTSCRVFIDGVIANLQLGQNRGAQDMVWDYNTNRLLLYSGIDKVLAVVDLNTNSSICYSDDNNVSVTDNLGGLALDSVGQLIGLEVQTGRVLRIDTRGCIDGNPATPCMTSVTSINNYTINGNGNTRGDAASCVSACTPPVITSSDVVTCVGSPTTVDISVSGATGPYSYVWGINQNSGTITNTTSEDVSYENDTAGSYKLYVTVSDIRGCQSTDSIDVSVVLPPDTVRQTAGLCFGDSLLFGSTIINSLGVYTRTLITSLGCDSVIELRVIRGSGCGILTPFSCPVMVGLLNEGPNPPDHDSYITVIDASTGSVGVQLPVRDSNGVIYQSLNGIGIVNTDGYGYAQYQRVPTLGEVVSGLLSGNYTYPSSMIQIGSNGIGKTLGSLVPPVSSGFNAHVVLGLLGSADNSGNYLVAALEGQVDAFTQVVSSYRFYVGRVSVPDTAVVWSAISLDTSCRVFIDGVIANLQLGQNRGAQDMVWDYNTNRLLLYSGIDKVLAVVDLNTNSSICYSDDNNVSVTDNLGGLALDSVGQLIGLEVQTGRVLRIDTRGCIDGNPATPCMTSVTSINNYTINGNGNTRGDAASCVSACTPPVLTTNNIITCTNTPTQLSVGVSPQGTYTYTWGIYSDDGTLVNSTAATSTYSNNVAGNFKVYITVENAMGCQSTDSLVVTVAAPPDTTVINRTLCSNRNDSIIFNGQIIRTAGIFMDSLFSVAGCDSLVQLVVTEIFCNFSPPVAVMDDTISFGTSIVIEVLNNDFDADGDSIYVCEIVTAPTHGTVTINSDGTITYIPTITSGTDSFQYRVCSIDGDSVTWVIITIEDCIIPNTFSPNGDTYNDFFEIPCIDGNEGSFRVFNRWGAEVFRNEHYDNVTGIFDGKYKGEDLPDGTYYYVLKYNSLQGKKIDRAGFIVIHRSSK